MGKRISIILVILLIALLTVLGYYLQINRKTLFTDPYKAVTPGASFVIETVDLRDFLGSLVADEGLQGEIMSIEELRGLNEKLRYLSELLSRDEFTRLLGDGTAVLSFHYGNNGRMESMMSIAIPGEIRLRHLTDIFRSSGIEDGIIGEDTGDYPMMQIPYSAGNNSDTVHITLISGLLVCSSSVVLIDEVYDQIKSDNDIRELPGFSRVLLSSGKNENKLFILFPNLRELLISIMGEENLQEADKITRLAGTAGGDIYLNENGLVLSGYTESTDPEEYLFRYNSVLPVTFETYKILPSSTVLFETFVFSPGEEETGSGSDVSVEISDFAGVIKEYLDTEITRAHIDIKEDADYQSTLIIYKLTNALQVEQLFLEGPGRDSDVFYFEPDDQIKIPVYKSKSTGLAGHFIPGLEKTFDDSFFAFYDNFMITGSSYLTISQLLYDNLLQKTLENDLIYREFESTLPSQAGYFLFCVPSRIINLVAGYLKDSIADALYANISSINKIQSAGYQAVASNEMIYNSLSVQYIEQVKEESTTEWETLLDTTAGIKPFFFTNHNTGRREIFVQDKKNNIYLINAAGRVLWKVPLREKIRGTVYMIDYYRNGKHQLLFSGKDYIHLVDRNGNYVERYPVKLRSPATNSMALFDYDNNQNYRLFIAGEDEKIYSYDKTGNVVRGWTQYKTSSAVSTEVEYFRVAGKDYIVVSDEGSIYFLDRTGNIRVNIRENVTRADGSSMRLDRGAEPSVVCTSPDGTIQHIFFDGSVRKYSMRDFSFDHMFDFFDIDGDGYGEYIFIDDGILYLYDHNRTQIFEREFESDNLAGPINFIFSSSDRKTGVYDIDNKLIYLVGSDGEIMNGFPLRGASMFSIGRLTDNRWHLIVGGSDNFLYNYRLE